MQSRVSNGCSSLFISSVAMLLIAAAPTTNAQLVITGVVDGPLTGGTPKAIEVCAVSNIPDLSVYGLGGANNGGGSDGEEFTFPSVPVAAGTFIYVASESTQFANFFGFAPDYTSFAASINGDDAIELFMNGSVVDVFGDINVDGTGQPWEYLDGWAYRVNGTGLDGETFVLANWTFSGPNALDGETTNASAATPFPIGTSTCVATPPPPPPSAGPDLLLTEIVVTPTGGEFVEIYNPTASPIDLSDVYLTDATFAGGGTYYYNIVTGANAGGGGFSDFHARFPDGASIAAGEYQTVSIAGSDDFLSAYAAAPTYELYEDGVGADAVPDMREALPGSINSQGGLTNGGEVVILYTWDGASDLVQDIDYALWGDTAEAVDKSGVSIDGPDVDATPTLYANDTPIASQEIITAGAHGFGDSFQRVDLAEGTETQAGGNGVTGSDETSENLATTWGEAAPTPGAAAAPPPPPPAGDWVINEIHADPASDLTGDANGDGVRSSSADEFVEIVNNSGGDVDISGWTLADGFTVRHVFPAGTVLPDNCSIVVFGGGSPTGPFGHSIVQTASGGSLGLNNGGDTVTLNDGVSDIAVVAYGGEGGANQSLTRDPDITGADPLVQHTGATGSGGALYSPGTQIDGTKFGGCPLPWVINEVHADPASGDAGDANGDGVRHFGNDEFVEIVNNSGSAADISGWTLADGFGVRHTFPADTVLLNGCSVVVFGGGSPTGAFGNSLVQNASTGSLGLNNSGDTVTLNDGVTDIAVTNYGSDGGDNQSLTLDPDVTGSPPYVKHTVATGSGGARFSPGTRIDATQFSGCPVSAEIYEIQGSGSTSPFVGSRVIVIGVVTAVGPDGFFIQTVGDGDPNTSDGIFVFTGGPPTVAVGDEVEVEGDVAEFFGMTELNGTLGITVIGPGAIPPAVVFDEFTPSPDPTAPSCAIEYECYEGMLVEIPIGVVGGSNQNFGGDPFAEVYISAGPNRAFREPGVEFPGSGVPGIPVWDGNPEVFEMDADRLGLPTIIIPARSTFSAVGVIGFEFGGYELWPTELDVTFAPLPVPVSDEGPYEMTVGSLNVFRLFDDVDDPATPNATGSMRDDFIESTAEYNRRLGKFAAHIVDVLNTPDILAVQEAEKLEVLQALATAVSALDASVNYTAYLVEGNDIGTIDVGFLVQDNVAVSSVTQLGAGELFTFDNPPSPLHDRPPLLIEAVADGTFPISVMVLHMRSLGGIENERTQRKRLRQATSVAQMVQDIQSTNPDVHLAVVGDFNAFEFTDGYVDVSGIIKGDFDESQSLVCSLEACTDLVSPNLVDEVLGLGSDERYSFVFRGNAQVLDHASTSQGLSSLVTGMEFGRGNADAADELTEDDGTLGDLVLRASDHDGLVLYVLQDEDHDTIPDAIDACLNTSIPETPPSRGLGVNHFVLGDGDTLFDTVLPNGNGPQASFSISDTAGCSCEQIIDERGLGNGHRKHGCSIGVMREWASSVSP